MSTRQTVTMQDLEFETAELLPSRETLYCWGGGINGSFDRQVSVLSGNNVLSGNSVSILSFGGSQYSSANGGGNNTIL